MDELEMLKRCAEVSGLEYAVIRDKVRLWHEHSGYSQIFDPLHDDAYALALIKQLGLRIEAPSSSSSEWTVASSTGEAYGRDDDLNRAIVRCVWMMAAKASAAA